MHSEAAATAWCGIFSGAGAMEALKMAFRAQMTERMAFRRVLDMLLALNGSVGVAQSESPSAATDTPKTSSNANADPSKPWIVRDPATGRLFQQQLVPVSVPVTRWEARTIEQTVYEPKFTTQVQQISQTTYRPSTQYAMQPIVRGWWNPFKQPVQAYQYVPITHWVPQTLQSQHPVLVQHWVPKSQKMVVYQPVQATETRQQLVQTELPQPKSSQVIATVPTPRQPLFRLPLLAQQRVLPWPSTTGSGSFVALPPNTVPNARSSPLVHADNTPQFTTLYASNGLRPVAKPRTPLVLPPLAIPRFATSPYAEPLQTTNSVNATASRDILQSGMQPTVLR